MAAQGRPSTGKKGITHLLLLGFVLHPAACGREANPLADTEWRLTALGNADVHPEMVGDQVATEFSSMDIRGNGPQFLRSEVPRMKVGPAPALCRS